MNFNNRLYKEHPLHLYSHELVDNKLHLTIINVNKGMVSTIFVVFNKKEYIIEVDSKNEIIELTCEYFDKEELGTPIIKWAIINEQKVE